MQVKVSYGGQNMKIWKIGDNATKYMQINTLSNEIFSVLSGDKNPVHFDEHRMSKTRFKLPIANGIQCMSAIGAAIVDLFVTEDTIVIAIEQHNSFVKPVFIPSIISATVTVDEVLPNNTYWLQCFVYNEYHEVCTSARFRVRVLDA